MNRPARILALVLVSASVAGVVGFWPGCAHAPITRQGPAQSREAAPSVPALPSPPKANEAAAENAALAAFAEKLKALQEVQTGDDATRDRLTRELLGFVNEDNVEDIVKSLSAAELDTPFGLAAMRIWMRAEPAKAAAWIGALPVMPSAHVWLVAAELARAPANLDDFAAHAAAGDWKTAVLHHAGRELADRDPLRALTLGLQLPEGAKRADLLETAFYSWSCSAPAAADAWLATQPDDPARARLLALGAKALATKDPEAGAGRLFSRVQDIEVLTAYAPVVLGSWAGKNAPAAAAWTARLPAGPGRDLAMQIVAERWSRSDAAAAAAWLRMQPGGVEMARRLAPEDPDAR